MQNQIMKVVFISCVVLATIGFYVIPIFIEINSKKNITIAIVYWTVQGLLYIGIVVSGIYFAFFEKT